MLIGIAVEGTNSSMDLFIEDSGGSGVDCRMMRVRRALMSRLHCPSGNVVSSALVDWSEAPVAFRVTRAEYVEHLRADGTE